MAIQLRSLFPLALPGMLALLGWWWFFSRKKEHIGGRDKQAEASTVELRGNPAIEELIPVEDACPAVSTPPSVTQPATVSKPSAEPPASLRPHPACRRSESSGRLSNTVDTRPLPGARRRDSTEVELALEGDETKLVASEGSLPSPHGAVAGCEHAAGRYQQGQAAAPAEKRSPGEKARARGAEGTGDAVRGESVLEGGVLSLERGSGSRSSKAPAPAPLGGQGEEGESRPPQVEGGAVGKLTNSVVELAHMERAKDSETPVPQACGGRARGGEESKEETMDENEIEQAAFRIVSKVISEATEEVMAATLGMLSGCTDQASAGQPQGQEEESCAPGCQETAPGPDALELTPAPGEAATAGAALGPSDAALPLPRPPADSLPPPKTYVSCLTSPLSSPTKDTKPKNSVHHLSLAAGPPPAAPLGELLDSTSVLGEEAGCVGRTADNSQRVPSVASSGQCSDSVSTSGLEDCCVETDSSPRDKATTPPRPQSTVPFSNGVLPGELSDVGTEDGWTVDAEADHSGGSDGNSMDSVDGCYGLRKTDSGFQNAQAGSSPKKVDLIIWEIEVPKHLVGRLIGKQGRYVSFLKQTSGAKIYISTLPYTQNIQICHIEGTQHHVDKALNLIGKKFKELNLTNIYAPPLPSLALPSLPMTSWLMLPDGITVEVIVVNQVNAGHLFVQQHTHPTFHALRSLDQQMYLCYSQPGIPTLPTPVEITVICAAPGVDGAWWRAQVVASYEETSEVEIRYVDYGGYKRVKVDVLRQIRSDFVTLPFQGAEVLLDSVMPLSDDEHFSPEADAAMSEMTGNTALLAQVTNYSPTGIPLIQLWSVVGDEVVLINRSLVERGLAQWVDSYYTSL
ncbi:A-kinase anchor protein 1, mitochondrial [Saccopteryx bilineata]|uniref:A-kinase anchor protein 1, mitochondrial n=1 Tax=Saccopteryx bilineata TaxID=59482 RepID=UPI00338FB918